MNATDRAEALAYMDAARIQLAIIRGMYPAVFNAAAEHMKQMQQFRAQQMLHAFNMELWQNLNATPRQSDPASNPHP